MIGVVISIIAVMTIVISVRLAKRPHGMPGTPRQKHSMSQQEDDELITVILPTINQDK